MSRTSTEVKTRYNNRVYDQLNVKIPKGLNRQFEITCNRLNVTKRQAIIQLLEEFVGK